MEVERIAELLLLKGEDFKDKERLRDLLKDYIKTKDEISYLEGILEDFEQLDINLKHLKRDAETIKSLLPRLSKYTNIPVFMKIVQMLDTVENIDINELESVRWSINKEIENLNDFDEVDQLRDTIFWRKVGNCRFNRDSSLWGYMLLK